MKLVTKIERQARAKTWQSTASTTSPHHAPRCVPNEGDSKVVRVPVHLFRNKSCRLLWFDFQLIQDRSLHQETVGSRVPPNTSNDALVKLTDTSEIHNSFNFQGVRF